MRLVLRLLILVALVAGAGAFVISWPRAIPEAEVAGLTGDPAAGEAVFWAAGCASCHAAEGATGAARLILAGGQEFPSQFGTFVAPNISSDPVAGIGDWTLAQFLSATQAGVSPEGRHYYPAFPYTAYRLAERQDMVDLFAFLRTLPASDTPSRPNEVGFPFSIRRGVGLWNALYLRDDFVVAGDLDAEAARGRYLAEALAHCGDCHTPRGALGATDPARWLQGAPDPAGGGRRIPGIAPDQLGWSTDEIASYFADGFTPEFDTAGGHMRSVIENLAQLTPEDRQAIAAYLARVPEAGTP